MYDLIIISAEKLSASESYELLRKYKPFSIRPENYPYLFYSNAPASKIARLIPILEENYIYYKTEKFSKYDFDILPKTKKIGVFEILILLFFIIMALFLYFFHIRTDDNLQNLIQFEMPEFEKTIHETDLKDIYNSTFSIYSYQKDNSIQTGTGFFITEEGKAVTSYHVIEHAKNLEIRSQYYNTSNIEIIAKYKYLDIAVLKTDQIIKYPIKMTSIQNIRPGDTVYSLGNPYGISLMVSRGIISNINHTFDGILYIQTDARIRKGSSGGPLVLSDGTCIGINNFIIQRSHGFDLGFCTPIGYLGFIYNDFMGKDLIRDYEYFYDILMQYEKDEKLRIMDWSKNLYKLTRIDFNIYNNRQGNIFFEFLFYNIFGITEFTGQILLQFRAGDFIYEDIYIISKSDYRHEFLRIEYPYFHEIFKHGDIEMRVITGHLEKSILLKESYFL